MPQTPDRKPGPLEEDDELRFTANLTPPTQEGAMNYDGYSFVMRDLDGMFNPRSSSATANNVLYVESVRGDDILNDGESPQKPFKTITAALDTAIVGTAVVVMDSSIYIEDLVISDRVFVDARFARLVGNVTISSCASLWINRHFAKDNDVTMIQNLGCTGRSIYTAEAIIASGQLGTFTGVSVLQNIVDEGSLKFYSKYVELSDNGWFIVSESSGGIVEKTAGSNNWTGSGGASYTAAWVNSILGALANWGVSSGPIISFVDDPTGTDPNARTLLYSFSTNTLLNGFNIYQYANFLLGRSPSNFKIYGAVDGADLLDPLDWTELGNYVGTTWALNDNIFAITSPGNYRYYRFVWLDSPHVFKTIQISRVFLTDSTAVSGGSIKFEVTNLLLANGSVGILATSPDCNYQGRIEVATGLSASVLISQSDGNISYSGTYANVPTLWAVRTGTLGFDVTQDSGIKGDEPDFTSIKNTGDQTIYGIKTFNSFPYTPAAEPSFDYEVANKKYVDDNSGGSSDFDDIILDEQGRIVYVGDGLFVLRF